MVTIKITDEQRDRAKKLYPFDKLKNSITEGSSNIFGALGEILIYDQYKDMFNVDFQSTYEYDMLIEGYRVDVKAKRTTVVPKENYLCSITKYKQDCDFYFFVRISTDQRIGYLLGYMQRDEFFTKAKYKSKGDLDVDGFVFKADGWHLQIKDLKQFKERN